MVNIIKEKNMLELVEYQRFLWEKPNLRVLFLELTDKSNLNCRHCGSKCNNANSTFLQERAIEKVLQSIARHCNPASIMLNITGGSHFFIRRLFR